ncbi:phage major capsid protein [Devosia sp.]|uniref:phage major capsid protein n=1 Tax=Devosia sp. TaxID=1871048 RepID=UPI001AD37A12|nr:phage major capsid protein [Devosia sp.]MBN9334961.1 phage major capsid protein [Devosia sp.]
METQEVMKRAQKALDWVGKRGDELDADEVGCLNGLSKGYKSFMTDAGVTMLDDIEHRYGVGGKGMGHVPFAHGPGHQPAEMKGVKVHHGAHGEVYELKAGTKLSSVIKAKEKPPVSMERWLAATMLGDVCEDKAALEYAHETKSVSSATSGVLLPTAYQSEWTDHVRAQMVLEAAGMTTVTMNAQTLTSSRLISDPAVAWRSEAGNVPNSDPTFQLHNLVAKSLAVRVQATAELAQDSPDWGSQLTRVITKALAVEVDRVGIMGTGAAGQPRGIVNTPGINTITGVGVPAHYGHIVSGLQKLIEAKCDLETVNRNAIMSPRTWAGYENLRATDSQPLQRPKAIENMAFRPTTNVPDNLGANTDESQLVLGDFSELTLGVRMEATIEGLKLQSFASNLMVDWLGWVRVDFLVRRPASFTVLEGIKAA